MVMAPQNDGEPGPEPVETFELVGGDPCLDFANTVSSYAAVPRKDKLLGYRHLLVFARRAGVIDEAAEGRLAAEADRRPAEAAAVLADARALRDATFALFDPGRAPSADALAVLDRALGRARAHEHLVTDGEGYALRLDVDDAALDRPLWALAASAAALLVSPQRARVRICGSARDRCTWLFLDESKNQSRRWCSMRDCGNRAKARRHYHKKRLGEPHAGEA
jgi:predicted RNA-binding Zn ribbon-like protein